MMKLYKCNITEQWTCSN